MLILLLMHKTRAEMKIDVCLCFKIGGYYAASFNRIHPDVNNYIRDYNNSLGEIEKLAAALKAVAFPNALELSELSAGFGIAQNIVPMVPNAESSVNTAGEIKITTQQSNQ